MSCYIYFYLKKKDTPMKDWHICLAHLCTSDARELMCELEDFGSGVTYNFGYDNKEKDPMYDLYTPLTDELLDNTIAYYDSKIQETKESKAKYEKELQKNRELYLKATSQVVLNDIKESISTVGELISWCDEEIERFSSLRYYISNTVRDVLDENNHYEYNKETKNHIKENDYELVYFVG